MGQWTEESVVALAPDASSVKSGRELASPRKWLTMGASGETVWGECQGSGKNPYQTEIDLTEPAFKCTCPSRKFPCKHALGLMLAYAANAGAFTTADPPAWVQEWLAARAGRAEAKAKKTETQAEKPVDAAAQAKRAAKREDNVLGGLHELQLRLHDLARDGLAAAQQHDYKYWDGIAARMVDAQAPGVARLIKQMPGLMTGGARYARALQHLARLHLLVEGYGRIGTLPADLQEELRALVGWTVKQEELLQGAGVRDRWLVTGRRVDEEDRLRVLRTWLHGTATGQPALLLAFAAAGQTLDLTLPPGALLDAELVFYPASLPLRAIVKTQEAAGAPSELPGLPSLDALFAAYGAALARNPWLEAYPASLHGAVVHPDGDGWVLRDAEGAGVPVAPRCAWGWEMLALSGGRPGWVMGEWDGETFLPLSCAVEGRVIGFA